MRRKASSNYVSFFAAFTVVSGLRLPFENRAPRGVSITAFGSTTDKEKVGNVQDIRYTGEVTVNGKIVTVALDTGSTDLWVNPQGGVGTFDDTKIPITLLYGDGTYGAKGTIGIAPVKFGSYTVEKQAFLDVTESTIQGLDDIGVYGILGLSFDLAQASKINDAVKAADGDDATWGHSFLRNVFDQHPDEPNFIAIDLARSDDLEDTSGGSFYIGEYDPTYAAVAKAPKLAQFPEGHNRWTTLLEGVDVGGSPITLKSSVAGVPSGQAQALLDTGDPTAMFPIATWNAIYSKIPGAVSADSFWIVPCNTTTIVELTFAGQKFPIHPLDLTTISDPIDLPDGSKATACVSAIRGADGFAKTGYEISLGDSFLRNVYSTYDFGDGPNGKPYMQLLSQITPEKAISQVASIRGKDMASKPPELPPSQLLKLLGDADPTSTADPTEPTSNTSNEDKSGSKPAVSFDSEDKSLNFNVDDETLKKYGLIAIGLLAVNLLVGLALLVFAVLNCIKKGASRNGIIAGKPQYAPVKLQEDYGTAPAYGYQKPYSQ